MDLFDAFNFEAFAQLSAAALVVVALIVMYLSNKAQNAAISAMSDASVKAVASSFKTTLDILTRANDDQRSLHQKEIAELRAEMASERKERDEEIATEKKERHEEVAALTKRVGDLESEVQKRDKRIKTLEDENAQLKSEIERLKGELNGKQDKEKAVNEKAA